MDYLSSLESESIHILREAAVAFERPVVLYSIGKDSSVLVHLCRKAFAPAPVPFRFLHIDTGWKFREMIEFRDRTARLFNLDLIVHSNTEAMAAQVSPFSHGSAVYTDIMKTQPLREAIDLYKFDAAIGGARRDEEKSRAKERVFSFRSDKHRWDPKNQRPEPWRLYNTDLGPGESMRIFPLSNWTEIDIWTYIGRESVDVVGLYFAAPRLTVERSGSLIVVDDDRFPLAPEERPGLRNVRFRTLGCYPLTAAVESDAQSIDQIISELQSSQSSERGGRLIDHDEVGSMEKKKQEGYF